MPKKDLKKPKVVIEPKTIEPKPTQAPETDLEMEWELAQQTFDREGPRPSQKRSSVLDDLEEFLRSPVQQKEPEVVNIEDSPVKEPKLTKAQRKRQSEIK